MEYVRDVVNDVKANVGDMTTSRNGEMIFVLDESGVTIFFIELRKSSKALQSRMKLPNHQ